MSAGRTPKVVRLCQNLDNGREASKQSRQMKTLSVSLFCALLLCSAAAQDATSAKATQASGASAESQMPPEIGEALKKYVAAYEARNLQDLLKVWPDLQNQKKDLGKIKQHFNDPNVSNEHMTLQPLQTQVLKDDAIVRCDRTERFAKTETSETGGDLIMNRQVSQTPPPSESTKNVNRTNKVWVKLHKNQDGWVIVSIGEKPLSL